eukprot:gene16532-18861_t
MVPKKIFGNGHVSSRLPKGRFYTGGFLDNQPHGYGQMLTSTDKRIKLSGIADSVLTGEGVIFEGEGHNVIAPDHIQFGAWKDGHFRGQVLNSAGDVVSTHSFKVDTNGVISSVNTKGAMLSGALVNHKLHGEGKITYPSGLIVEGIFDHHKLHGEGKVTQPDGRLLQGEFRYGAIFTGQGLEVNYRNTGKVRDGVWVGGVFTGTCS